MGQNLSSYISQRKNETAPQFSWHDSFIEFETKNKIDNFEKKSVNTEFKKSTVIVAVMCQSISQLLLVDLQRFASVYLWAVEMY